MNKDQRIKLSLYQHSTDQIFVEYFSAWNYKVAIEKAVLWNRCKYEQDRVMIAIEEGILWQN